MMKRLKESYSRRGRSINTNYANAGDMDEDYRLERGGDKHV
jgi:hypothetical protein